MTMEQKIKNFILSDVFHEFPHVDTAWESFQQEKYQGFVIAEKYEDWDFSLLAKEITERFEDLQRLFEEVTEELLVIDLGSIAKDLNRDIEKIDSYSLEDQVHSFVVDTIEGGFAFLEDF